MPVYGLIGRTLSHSFSRNYFSEKFEREGLSGHEYRLFELADIRGITQVFSIEGLSGLNVTIPYKSQIIPFLNRLDDRARRIGAVNVVKVQDGEFIGYNSDYTGFKKSLEEWAAPALPGIKALILGTGGASLAVQVVLEDLGIPFLRVSRTPGKNVITYQDVTPELLAAYHLVINTTPLGMSPETTTSPDIPYSSLTGNHYLYDLVYNPETTMFMKKGAMAGARTMNGLNMLYLQAEASWAIWNDL